MPAWTSDARARAAVRRARRGGRGGAAGHDADVPARGATSCSHEGDPGDRLYVIVDGKIKLGAPSGDGRENLLAVLGPGEMFGELSLFDPGAAHGDRHRAHRRHADRRSATTTCSPGSTGAPRWPSSLLARAGPAAAPDQRGDGRPRLQRRARPGGQGAARPRRQVRRRASRTACGSPTTSPRRSWPSSSAPPARRSTRRWPTSQNRGWLRLERAAVVLLDLERLDPPRPLQLGPSPATAGRQVVQLGPDATARRPATAPGRRRHRPGDDLARPCGRRPRAPRATCSSRSSRCQVAPSTAAGSSSTGPCPGSSRAPRPRRPARSRSQRPR